MPFLPDIEMEYDPDGSTEQVAVVMKGKTYRDAGLSKSKFPNIEGPLYDKLCEFPRHKYRDEVRKLALNIAIMAKETNFKPSIEWLDNFMRRFCISRKKSGLSYKKNFLKIKGSKNKSQLASKEAISPSNETNQEIHSEPSNNITDPLDLGDDFTSLNKGSVELSEKNSSILRDILTEHADASDETFVNNPDDIEKLKKYAIRANGQTQNLNNNKDNLECPSDSDDSIKEIPREKSPEKEVISLIESDDEIGLNKRSMKEEDKNKNSDIVLPTDPLKPTEEGEIDSYDLKQSTINLKNSIVDSNSLKKSTMDLNSFKKSNVVSNSLMKSTMVSNDLQENINSDNLKKNNDTETTRSQNDKTEDESGKGDKENEEVEEEEDIVEDDDEDNSSDSEDSDSGSESGKGEKDDDLVIKQRKSWEDMNHVNYSKKEEKYYSNNMSGLQKKLDEKITQCTACFEQVNHTVKEDIFTHPVLGVLVCKKCFKFYGKGDFNKDADGYDEYCRWCANGGDLLLCDHCTNGFCKKCIKRNLGRTAETEAINSLAWKCYVCDLSPLTEVRAFHRAVLDQLRSVSIISKTLSRKEKREWSIKQKFSLLKIKRKNKNLQKNVGNKSKETLPSEKATKAPSEFEKAVKDIQELCVICLEQVEFIVKKSLKDNSNDAETRGQRRLLRLAHHMGKNFEKLESSLGESSGLNVEEILLSNSQHNGSEKNSINSKEASKVTKNSSNQNPSTIGDSSKEAPLKQTEKRPRTSSSNEDGHESPPCKRIVMETDDEMETEQKKTEKSTANNSDSNDDNDKNNENRETRKSNDDNDLPHCDSSNEGEVSDAPMDDAASSKNPDGDTEREEIDDDTVQEKSSDKLKPSQTPASDSESDLVSQSLLKDVLPSQIVANEVAPSSSGSKESKDKGTSSDDSKSSKKGIIYRKSKTLKERRKKKSEKELSNEDDSDENLSKKEKSKETLDERKLKRKGSDSSSDEDAEKKTKKTKVKNTSNYDKLKKELMEGSESNDDGNKKKKKKNDDKLKKELMEDSESSDDGDEKKKKKKVKKDRDSNKKGKKNLKAQNDMKSLLATDSDESNDESDCDSDVENIIKKASKLTNNKSKKSSSRKKKNYKPKPKSVQEAIQSQQLKSTCSVKVEKLPKNIQSKLKEEESVCITDFPEYFAKDVELGLDSETDNELDAILKSKTILKKRKYSDDDDDSENDADSEDNSQHESEDNSKEKEEKKPAENKAKKEKKNGLMDISLDNEGDNVDEDDDSDEDEDDKKKKSLSKDMKALLVSSEEDEKDEENDDDNLDSSCETLTQEELEKKKRELYDKKKKKLDDKANNSESENDEIVKKVKKKGFLSFTFSTSEDDDDDDDESEKEGPRKSRMFIESDSDFEVSKKKTKDFSNDLFTSSSDDDEEESSSDDSTKKSKKSKSRKRIRRPASSSDEEEANENDLETPKKRHRRIIRDEDLLQSTKDATQEEKERRDRVKERQLRYNKMFCIDVEKDQSGKTKLVLDFNEETKEELVKVNEKLVSHLKPHQHDGIKFMWDATIESVERLESGERGGGCILAHCMGLGKTLQVIAYIHTLLTNKHVCEKISRVMVCCPVNTVYNWKQEFKQWLRGKLDSFEVIELVSAKDLWGKVYRLEDWYKEGGVCIIGYDMFRNCSNEKNKRTKGALRDKFQKYLVDPGADVMVCDEGHILKNEKTALSIAINKIKTRRRIILTGTPLQNNLKEYHCMIQFVKPNLLGSKKEFMNRFVNPIEAGQCGDASKKDVSRMKKRAHILHSLLEGCVQRFDYTVLKPFLPPKFEYVISVQMSKEQIKLYSYYLENLAQGGPKRQGSGLFVDVNNLSRIWSHPVVLFYALDKFRDQDLDEEEGDGNLDGFINDSETSESSGDERRKKKKKKAKNGKEDDDVILEENAEDEKKNAEGTAPDVEVEEATVGLTLDGKVRRDWYIKVVQEMCVDGLDEDSFFNRIEISGKLYLLFEILREASSIGDKVLLFSQSIMVLDMIQEFLRMIDQREIRFPPEGKEDTAGDIPQPYRHWILEKDYYRLDGSTPADVRKDMCKSFNNPTNDRCRLFLISTRAGGVGINLVAANRVVIFDTSWNPSHDTQSIFRVYRFGQKKPCYIYRFVAQGTMEEKIYSRQVTKISTSRRVVDEHQIKRHFNMAELTELYQFTPSDPDKRETPSVPDDKLLAELLIRNKNWIVSYHEQDSLLENQTNEGLTEEERNAAWEDYENEKKGIVPQKNYSGGVAGSLPSLSSIAPFDIEVIYNSVLKSNPKATQAQLYENVYLATEQLQRVHISQFQNYQAVMYNMATNPMLVPELLRSTNFKDRNELIQHYDAQLRVLEANIQAESNVMKQIGQITNSVVSHNAKIAAGLARGNPAPSAASSTAQYVSRNVPVTSLVNTTFKSVIPRPSTSSANNLPSTSTSSGSADTASKSDEKVEITLE